MYVTSSLFSSILSSLFLSSPPPVSSRLLSSQACLKNRKESSQLLMDTKNIFPVTFPFIPSPVALETIQIPSSLSLGFLTRV